MNFSNRDHRQKLFVDDLLYSEYDLKGVDEADLAGFFWHQGTIDAFCSDCKTASIFQMKNETSVFDFEEKVKDFPKIGLITVELECTRHRSDAIFGSCNNKFLVCFRRKTDKLIKIGQHPSKADLDFATLDSAFDELHENYRTELGTAIGLYSHGVGIGSFVYLRRIFEHLIEDAHQEAQAADGWDDDKFKESRIKEKIELLTKFLPSRLVRSANLYGILSKGIHELSEQECKNKFPLVRQAIQLILKERHENKEYETITKSINKK